MLDKYNKCIIIDLHSFSNEMIYRLFGYENLPDICIGVEEDYYSEEIKNYLIEYFKRLGYSVEINYPYSGSIVPNKYYGKKNTGIISIMIEVNKNIYLEDIDSFKEILYEALCNIK